MSFSTPHRDVNSDKVKIFYASSSSSSSSVSSGSGSTISSSSSGSSSHHSDTESEGHFFRNKSLTDRSRKVKILNIFSSSPRPISISNNSVFKEISDDDDEDDGPRIGRKYQADIPDFVDAKEVTDQNRSTQSTHSKATLVWFPREELTDEAVEHYLAVARDKFQYSAEQALGILCWHGYDMQSALEDLLHYVPVSEDWCFEDKVLFEQAIDVYGKAFDRFGSILPDKTMSSIISYYYKWKNQKLRSKRNGFGHRSEAIESEQEDDDDRDDLDYEPEGIPKNSSLKPKKPRLSQKYQLRQLSNLNFEFSNGSFAVSKSSKSVQKLEENGPSNPLLPLASLTISASDITANSSKSNGAFNRKLESPDDIMECEVIEID